VIVALTRWFPEGADVGEATVWNDEPEHEGVDVPMYSR
jgi:hypothetical protein